MKKIAIIIISLFLLLSAVNFGTSKPTLNNESTSEMDYSIELFSNDVIALMDHLGIKQAIIIGVSMGGMVAQRMAVDHSNYIKKLILVDTMSHMDKCLQMKLENGAILADRFGMEVQARNGLPWAFSTSFINEHFDEIINIINDVSSLPAGPYSQIVKSLIS